jgi:hypothetical protein
MVRNIFPVVGFARKNGVVLHKNSAPTKTTFAVPAEMATDVKM